MTIVMKKLTIITLACIGLCLASSCSTGDYSPDNIIPFTFTSPDGFSRVVQQTKGDGQEESPEVLTFSQAVFYESDSDYPGCMSFLANTNGKMWNDAFYLSLLLDENSLIVGSAVKIERLFFALIFSSDSQNMTNTAKGNIFVKQRTNDMIVLRFDKVVFTIKQGSFTMNGDLIYTLGKMDPLYSDGA